MKEESLLLLSDLQKLINQVVLIDYTIIILGGDKDEEVRKKVTLDKRSLQAYKFCVCSNCPCPSGTSSYSAKASDSERKAPTN